MKKKTELEWVDIYEDLPLVAVGYKKVSDFIELLLDDGSTIAGFYDTEEDIWYNHSSRKLKEGTVKAWRSLE